MVFAGFPSVKDFVPQLVAANIAKAELSKRVRSSIEMPAGSEPDISPLGMARSLDEPEPRAALIAALRSAVAAADGARVGLPAVLGANYHPEAYADDLRRARHGGVRGADHPAVGARASGCTAR